MSVGVILHVTHADGRRERVPWPEGEAAVRIGRTPSAEISLSDHRVSRSHAVIEWTGDELMVVDLGSPNGTFVDGRAVRKAKLEAGAEVMVGASRIRVEFEANATPNADNFHGPARVGQCPRCRHELAAASSKNVGYRGAPIRFSRCDACRLAVLEGTVVSARYGKSEPLSALLFVRARGDAREQCPTCLSGLARLTLEWDSRWVVLEECPSCATIVLDDGEGRALDALFRAFEPR